MAALNKLVENGVETDEKREMLASVGLIMPHLETTLARFEEAGLGKYVLPEVQKKYMLRREPHDLGVISIDDFTFAACHVEFMFQVMFRKELQGV